MEIWMGEYSLKKKPLNLMKNRNSKYWMKMLIKKDKLFFPSMFQVEKNDHFPHSYFCLFLSSDMLCCAMTWYTIEMVSTKTSHSQVIILNQSHHSWLSIWELGSERADLFLPLNFFLLFLGKLTRGHPQSEKKKFGSYGKLGPQSHLLLYRYKRNGKLFQIKVHCPLRNVLTELPLRAS